MTITVDGTALTTAFNVSYQAAIAEVGQSGISISQLSFDTVGSVGAGTAAAATCDMIPGITFYINNRTKNGHITHVECLDAAAFLDQEIQLTQQDITREYDQQGKLIGEFVGAAVIAEKIRTSCKGLIASVPWTPTAYGFPLDYVKGKTFQQILTEISEVCAGFYTMVSGNILTLRYLNEMDAVNERPHHSITYHSAVNVNGDFRYDCIAVETPYEVGYIGANLATDFNTLTISNGLSEYVFPLYDATKPDGSHYTHVDTTTVPDELDHIVGLGHSFDGWTCDSVIVSNIPVLGDYGVFQTGEELRITDISVRFIGNTMLAALGGGIPTSGEIGRRSRRQIELDNKMTLGSTYGPWRPNDYQVFLMEQASTQSSGGGS